MAGPEAAARALPAGQAGAAARLGSGRGEGEHGITLTEKALAAHPHAADAQRLLKSLLETGANMSAEGWSANRPTTVSLAARGVRDWVSFFRGAMVELLTA